MRFLDGKFFILQLRNLMASSEKVFYSVFPIEGTVNDRGLILYVRESFFTATTTLTSGTTLANFLAAENPPKGDAITQGYGDYVYQEQLTKEGNNLRFLFLKNKTEAESLQVVKPAATINEVTFWPDWLITLYALDAIVDVQQEYSDSYGETLTKNVRARRVLDRYALINGGEYNTKHIVEEFFSNNPISSLYATEPRADNVFYSYYGTRESFNCIHDTVIIPELFITADRIPDFGTPNARNVLWEQGSVFPATNHISWVPHYRKLIVTERDGGYYYRRHQVFPPRLPRPIEI